MLKLFGKEILFCLACESMYTEENKPYILNCGNTICNDCVFKYTRVVFDKSDPSCHFDHSHHHILEDVPVNYLYLEIIRNFRTNMMKKENIKENELEDYFKICKSNNNNKITQNYTCLSDTVRIGDSIFPQEFERSFIGVDSKSKFQVADSVRKLEKFSYHGEYKNGLKHGEGMYLCDEFVYTGNFENDVPCGKGQMSLKKIMGENILYEGIFSGFKDGEGVIIYQNGDKYQGKWTNLMKEGRGKLLLSNGDFYEGASSVTSIMVPESFIIILREKRLSEGL